MTPALELDAERAAVRDAVAAWCGDAVGVAFDEERWRELAGLGVLLVGADGESGACELVASFEALGAAAAPGPLVETVLAVRLLPAALRQAVASGEVLVAVGEPPLFSFAPLARHFVELSGERAFLALPTGPIEAVDTLAGDPWGRVVLRRERELEGGASALRAGRVAAAALLAAGGRTVLERAAAHARTRKQFGRAIGEFQAVAHPLAHWWIHVGAAEMLARAAARGLDDGAAEAGELAAAAWRSAREAALGAAMQAHQTFGAVGITLEGALFPLTRRIRQWASLPLGEAQAEAELLAAVGLA
ncbi:MAG: acyl-CoA dehydrogenase family protein [Myxococcota bacterium]